MKQVSVSHHIDKVIGSQVQLRHRNLTPQVDTNVIWWLESEVWDHVNEEIWRVSFYRPSLFDLDPVMTIIRSR